MPIDIFKASRFLVVTSSAARKRNIFSGESRVPIDIFLSPMHQSGLQPEMRIHFIGEGRVPIEFFQVPCTIIALIPEKKKKNFSGSRVPIDTMGCFATKDMQTLPPPLEEAIFT